MSEQELRIFKKENEERAIELVKSLKFYQVNKAPNKASVLVEDVLPLVTSFIDKIRLNEMKMEKQMKIENAEVLKEHLDKLISDETYHKIELDYITPVQVQKFINEIDSKIGNLIENSDFNGWELDFWMPFKYKNQKLMFTGSWYYGNYAIVKN